MEQERAHRHKTAARRNTRYLAQAATMRCNLVGRDAPEPMRPWNHAQGPIGFSAVVEMNADRNQLNQEISGRLAKPRAFLFRPRLAGRIGGSCRHRDAQVLMQGD
jgi:hypothetical protein